MLELLELLPMISLYILGIGSIIGIIWILNSFRSRAVLLQQMFCPEDRSSCHCRSCRSERGE